MTRLDDRSDRDDRADRLRRQIRDDVDAPEEGPQQLPGESDAAYVRRRAREIDRKRRGPSENSD